MINIAVRRFETDLRVLVFLDEKVFYQIVGWVYISFLLFLFSKRVRPCFIEDSAANVRNAMHIPYAHFFWGGRVGNNRFLLDQTLLDGNLGIDD